MKREEVGALIRKGLVPWIEQLPESRPCLTVITVAGPRRQCSRPGLWTFTADGRSFYKGGVYCWTHLLMIASSGEEQARLEEYLREVNAV